MKTIKRIISPEIFFHIMVLLSVIFYLQLKYTPNMDAPQHLYNANVIKQLLFSNDAFSQFFEINSVIVGYWIGHAVLSLGSLLFPGFIAEKITIILYIIGISYSFKYLVSYNKTKGSYIIFFIFPFTYSFYALSGYYSFSYAAIFFFLFFGYYLRNEMQLNKNKAIVLAVILLLSFLSHAFVYAITCLSIFIFWISSFLIDLYAKKGEAIKTNLRKALFLLGAALPSLLLFARYMVHIRSINSAVGEQGESVASLASQLFKIRPIIGFHFGIEQISTYVFMALIILLILVVYKRIKKPSEFITQNNIWLVIALVLLGLYFLLPDRITAGNLTHRIGLFFFYVLIIWLNQFRYPKWIEYSALVLITVFFIRQRVYHFSVYKGLNESVAQIEQVKDEIEPNSTLLPILEKTNWNHNHFLCYLAIDNKTIYLKNPQAQGKFPVVWNYDELPYLFFGHEKELHFSYKFEKDSKHEAEVIKYVAIFDYRVYKEKDDFEKKKKILDKYYEEVARSDNNSCVLYKFSMKDQLQDILTQVNENPNEYKDLLKEKDSEMQLSQDAKHKVMAIRALESGFK